MRDKQLFLLRHCVTSDTELGINGSQTDTPLSKQGFREAKKLTPKLLKNEYDLIVVSPLCRTLQTVKPYLDTLKSVPPILTEQLTIERNLGLLTNSRVGDGKVSAHFEESGASRVAWIPPEGESIEMLFVRAQKFMKQLEQRQERSILICGHQIFLRCIELLLLNLPLHDDTFYAKNPPKLEPGEMRSYTMKNSGNESI